MSQRTILDPSISTPPKMPRQFQYLILVSLQRIPGLLAVAFSILSIRRLVMHRKDAGVSFRTINLYLPCITIDEYPRNNDNIDNDSNNNNVIMEN